MAELNSKKAISNDDIYTVEKVLRKRCVPGRVEYLLKLAGFSEKHNSCEPEENVVGNVLIEDFNRKQQEKVTCDSAYILIGKNQRSTEVSSPTLLEMTPKRILGTILVGEEQMFFVEEENGTQPKLCTARLANQEFPQLEIDYYASIAEIPK